MFKNKRTTKEYYSLRKFKGVGLASALVGLAFLSPSVLAEEVGTQPNTATVENVRVSSPNSETPTEVGSIVSNVVESNTGEFTNRSVVSQPVSEPSVNTYNATPSIVDSNKESADVKVSEASVSDNKVAETPKLEEVEKSKSDNVEKPKVRSKRSTESESTSVESSFVSEKAKEVTKELSDNLVMDKEDTASTSATLFKVAEGITLTEDEKKYNKRLAEAFDDFPELVRSQVNSLTFVREPNGTFGFTYSKEGNVNINMQYYHPELTGNEPGSVNQYLGVLGHEVGHIMNARSFRDGDTWSYSRDPKYAELSKEVHGSDEPGFLIGRWASDFGDYMSYLRGDYKPQGYKKKVMDYMNELFTGILTPRADRITPELKVAVDSVNAGSTKKLVYDGHVELVADYKRLGEVKAKVKNLNSAEVTKVTSKSRDHYKTYGYRTLVTTKYTANGSNIAETTSTDKGTPQLDLPGYNFVEKEVTHEGLLVEYKYSAKNTYSLDNEKLSADLDVQADPSFIGDRNKANLRFTLKEPVSNLRLSYKIQNLTTGVYQVGLADPTQSQVDSTNLNGRVKKDYFIHEVGSLSSGYHASADLTYGLQNGAHGDNTYRMTATFLDGNTEIGSVSKTFVGKVASFKEGDLQGVSLKSQVDLNDGKTVGAIVKNGNLYRPYIGAIGHLNPETKLENLEIGKARSKDVYKDQAEDQSKSKDSRVRYTILHDDYRLNAVDSGSLPVLRDMKDETTNKFLGSRTLESSMSKKDALGYTVTTYNLDNWSVSGITDTWGTFSYVGSDKTARTDKVPIKIELLKVIDGKETVVDSTVVTKDVEIVNYDESLKPFFAEDFQIDRRVSLGLATKAGDQYKIHYGIYGTNLEHVHTWSFDNWKENSSDSAERYRLSDIDSNKHVFLENMVSLNIKKPTNAVFSDVDYTVHMNVFKRNDGKPLNFEEITLRSWVNRNPILTLKEYSETAYWLDESGTRHKLGSKVSAVDDTFETRYTIPTNAKSIEIDIQGKVPIDYGPSYLMQYITDDTFEKVRDENRYLGANESLVYDSRAYTAISSLTDKLLNKKRDFTNHAIIRNKEILDAKVHPDVFGADRRSVFLNQPFRLTSGHVALASSNGQLTTNNLLNTTSILEDYPAKRFVLLEDGVRLSDASWDKQSTFEFNGKTYSLYTKPWNESKDINESDFATNILISLSASNLISNKQYDAYTGLIYKVKEGVGVPDGYPSNSAELVYDRVERKRLDQKILSVLGETSNNNQNDVVKLKGVKIDLNTKRSLEFTVTQTVEDSNVVTQDYAKSAGKQVDVVVTLSNGAQTTSPTLEVIQKLPVGDLNYTFVAPKENSDYTVFYTSDTDVSSSSNWVSSKPSNVTGLKWVRKSALNTGTIDKVAYSIQVSNDKSRVTKSVASATMLNGNLTGTINDVAIRNNQEYRTLTIRKQTYTAGGILIENVDDDVLSIPVGETVRYKDVVKNFYLDSVAQGNATQTSSDYTLPTVKPGHWDNETFVVPNRDTTMTFRFTQPADPTETRRTYTTTWENGYVEPDIQKLQTLFSNVRSYEFLPNESTQAVKKFNLTYTSGQKGVGYVDIKIEPKREKVVGILKGITYQGDESKDLGYKETISGVNLSYDKVTNYPVDSTGTFSEVVSKENEVAAKDATVILGTKPTVKTESTSKSTTYVADPDQTVKGKETIVSEGTDGSVKTTTTYTVNPTTGDITSTDSVETVAKVDKVIKVGNKEVTTEPITMEVVYEADPSLEKDVQEVDVEGNAGVREITTTYTVSPTDGTLSNPQRTDRVTTPMVTRKVRVGSVHRDVVETEITTKYISDDTKVRDSKEDISTGTKGIQTTTTTYQVDRNTGATHSPTTQVENQPMVQKVVKVGTKPTVEVEPIAITTKYIFDPKLAYGERIVEEKGSEGRVVTITTYTMNESDGSTTADTPDVRTVAMVQRVIRVGVKPTVEETPLDFSTFYEPDPEAEKDSRVDKVVGKPGKVTTTTTYTYDETTGVVTPNPSTSQTEQPTDRIVKVGTRPNVVETPIDFTTTYEADPESPRDSKTDKVVGKNGTTTVTTTYSVDPKTGVLTENPSVTTTKDPVNAIIKVGTKSTEVVEVLPSPKRFIKDGTRPKDEEPLTEQGRTGSKTTVTTYSVDPRTGITTSNEQPPVTVDPTETIVRVPAGDKVVEEKIAITTRYIEDVAKDFGHEEELSKGSEGKIITTTTYNVNPTNGTVTEGKTTRKQTDMLERVVKKGTKPKVTETSVAHMTRYERDEESSAGQKSVSQKGKDGKTTVTVTYTLNPKTGVVVENPSVTTEEPQVTEVVKVGTKPKVVTETLSKEVRYIADPTKNVGETNVIEPGEDGTVVTTTPYILNDVSGTLSEGKSTIVRNEGKPQVVSVGTKPKVEVSRSPITIRYIAKEDVDYGVRTIKSEGSETITTTTTNYSVNPDGTTSANTPVVETIQGTDRVIEVGIKTSTTTLELPFNVETQYDSSLEAGQTVIDQDGKVGSKTITTTYSLNETTGDVTSNTTETSVQPKPKKVRIGTGVRSTNVRHVIHDIQFETETIVDRFLPKGKEIVENEGTLGKDIETIVEQLFNGEVKSSESTTKRVVDPVKRVVRVGTYEFAKPIENLTIDPVEFEGGVNPVDAPSIEIPEFIGGVNPNEAPTYDKPEFEGGVNPNDAPVVEIPEFNGGVTPNEAPIHTLPEFTGEVSPNDAPIVEIPEYTEPVGTTPNDAPVLELPEFTGGVNPYDAPVHELPEFTGGVTPNEAPIHTLPEFTGEVSPNDAPILELPELKVPEEPAKPQPTDVGGKVDEAPKTPTQTPVQENQLPNTGGEDSILASAMGLASLLTGLGIASRKRKED